MYIEDHALVRVFPHKKALVGRILIMFTKEQGDEPGLSSGVNARGGSPALHI